MPPAAVSVADEPAQIDESLPALIIGVGFTVITKLVDEPMQLLADGVTVMVDVIADAVLLVAVKADMLPVPDDARPMLAALFVQL